MSKGVGSIEERASAGTEGARRATGVPADGAAGEAGLAPGQRLGRLLASDSIGCAHGIRIYRAES